MNAHVALLEPDAEAAPCAQTLTRINESLRARERLLTASAKASRLLLETPDVRAAIPAVLGLIGEAAHVDRVSLMQARKGPDGERLLVAVSEWTADGTTPSLQESQPCTCDERNFAVIFAAVDDARGLDRVDPVELIGRTQQNGDVADRRRPKARSGPEARRGVERDAHDVGIFDIEQAGLRVEIIGLAAQAAADDLLAQEFGAERAHPQDVGDRVGVPALGQHRDRDDATHLLAEPFGLAASVLAKRGLELWGKRFSCRR